MNSKLQDILHRMARYYEAVALRRTPPNKTDFATAEKAIRKAVAEEMLEIIGEEKMQTTVYTRYGDGTQRSTKHPIAGYKVRDAFRAELRQKITEWSSHE